MPEISFLFRVNGDCTTQYGKLRHLSDDHNGVDVEIRPYILSALDTYMRTMGLSPITKLVLGVIGILDNETQYCSEADRDIFHLYLDCSAPHHMSWTYYYGEITDIIQFIEQ